MAEIVPKFWSHFTEDMVSLIVCLFACLFVCLLACLLACLFVCLLACLLVVCLSVCLFACCLLFLYALYEQCGTLMRKGQQTSADTVMTLYLRTHTHTVPRRDAELSSGSSWGATAERGGNFLYGSLRGCHARNTPSTVRSCVFIV